MEEVKTVKMEELYITPFTARREYDKEGLIQRIPVVCPTPDPSHQRGGECWRGIPVVYPTPWPLPSKGRGMLDGKKRKFAPISF